MTLRLFNIVVPMLVLSICATAAVVGYRIDLYGVYRDTRGRRLVPYDNERMFKYLFSYDYIPNNFDAVLIGSSITDNWDTSAVSGLRLYNASVNGGNATEESLILRNVLVRSCPVAVVFTIHPYLTETSGRRSGYMHDKEYWAGLGSLQVFEAYYVKWEVDHNRERAEYNPFGQDDFDPPSRLPETVLAVANPAYAFTVDDNAWRDYADMIQLVRRCGAAVRGLMPPVEQQEWDVHRGAYERYYAKARTLFHPDEPIVDMNAESLAAFRADRSNFSDGVHLSRLAAQQAVALLDERLRELGVSSRGLRAKPALPSSTR